ncbi:hypothetical protein RhiirA4_478432 [Rhizophagus irregularis]|uniref:Uncharacterized protein n=1 Tax=Rhizophagus irregularis TaxID=588596 RepID=A0A2I1HES4_9GLOM|nr:hypothetical protein RhiirA4_478432 [Rhizophagus irregularis]
MAMTTLWIDHKPTEFLTKIIQTSKERRKLVAYFENWKITLKALDTDKELKWCKILDSNQSKKKNKQQSSTKAHKNNNQSKILNIQRKAKNTLKNKNGGNKANKEMEWVIGRTAISSDFFRNVRTRIRSLEKSVTSRFVSIRISIEDLQNKINQHYAVQSFDFDQQSVSNESEASNRSRRSGNSTSSSSGNSTSGNSISSTLITLIKKRSHFRQVFNSNKGEVDSLDYAFETVRREIRQLTGEKVGKETVKNFYYGVGDPKFNIVMLIICFIPSLKPCLSNPFFQ